MGWMYGWKADGVDVCEESGKWMIGDGGPFQGCLPLIRDFLDKYSDHLIIIVTSSGVLEVSE